MKTNEVQEIPSYGGGTDVRICATKYENLEARIAVEIAHRLALTFSASVGTESHDGRQSYLLHSPEAPAKLAKVACEFAKELVAEFAARDWLLDVPLPKVPQK